MKTDLLKLEIANCEFSLEFECPLRWENLYETGDEKVRFCGECKKEVFFCENIEDLYKHAELKRCVAFAKTEEIREMSDQKREGARVGQMIMGIPAHEAEEYKPEEDSK